MAELDLEEKSPAVVTHNGQQHSVKKDKKEKKDKEGKDKKEKKEKKDKTDKKDKKKDKEKTDKKEKKEKKEKKQGDDHPSTATQSPMQDVSSPTQGQDINKKKRKLESVVTQNGISASNGTELHKKPKLSVPSTPSSSLLSPSSSSSVSTPAAASLDVDVPDAAGNPPLSSFPIHPGTLSVLYSKKITHAFPIQAATFSMILAGEDVVGRAFTGTGKTLAFALPICERLQANDFAKNERLKVGRSPRVIVLTPTRELAKQVSETFQLVGPRLSHTTVYGGAPYPPMEAALRRGVDVVVGTCGRVQDLIDRKALSLSAIQVIIMDEADEMLNMGFADDVEKILESVPRVSASSPITSVAAASPTSPIQTLLFSATLPSWVQSVAKKYLRSSHRNVDLVGNIAQKSTADVSHYAIACHWSERNNILKEVINVHGGEHARTIVFTETKKEANEIAVNSSINAMSGVLHGDIAQSQRETTLKGFRDGKFSVLIATDVAARGIDISDVTLVIQCEPPQSVETYIHRSGRTGRAGSKGVAVTFYTTKQVYWLNQIERVARIKFIKAGIPQRDDIYASAANAAVKQVTTVHRDVIPHFLSAARSLLESHAFAPAASTRQKTRGSEEEDGTESDASTTAEPDPAYVLAAALARVSGHTEPLQSRSLLMSVAGWTTIHFTAPIEIRALSFVWSAIRRWLFTSENESDEKVKGMRVTLDRHGAVFDIPSSEEAKLAAAQKAMSAASSRERNRFEICKVLPPLPQQEVVRPETRRFGRGRDGERGGSGGRASFGGGGRGAGRGGRGGRGGGRGGRGGARSSY